MTASIWHRMMMRKVLAHGAQVHRTVGLNDQTKEPVRRLFDGLTNWLVVDAAMILRSIRVTTPLPVYRVSRVESTRHVGETRNAQGS